MKIIVRAKPRAKAEKVERLDKPSLFGGTEQAEYRVSVKELPVAGKANEAIIRALAEYFKVPKSSVRIISGQTSKRKIVELN